MIRLHLKNNYLNNTDHDSNEKNISQDEYEYEYNSYSNDNSNSDDDFTNNKKNETFNNDTSNESTSSLSIENINTYIRVNKFLYVSKDELYKRNNNIIKLKSLEIYSQSQVSFDYPIHYIRYNNSHISDLSYHKSENTISNNKNDILNKEFYLREVYISIFVNGNLIEYDKFYFNKKYKHQYYHESNYNTENENILFEIIYYLYIYFGFLDEIKIQTEYEINDIDFINFLLYGNNHTDIDIDNESTSMDYSEESNPCLWILYIDSIDKLYYENEIYDELKIKFSIYKKEDYNNGSYMGDCVGTNMIE